MYYKNVRWDQVTKIEQREKLTDEKFYRQKYPIYSIYTATLLYTMGQQWFRGTSICLRIAEGILNFVHVFS